MIPASSPEQDVLAAQQYRIDLKIEIADALGMFQDYSDYAGLDLQCRTEVNVDVDARIKQATLELVRASGGNSLAPLLNSDIAVGRGVRISAARIAAGATPISGDFKPLFAGTTDEWGHPSVGGDEDENRLVLVARDGLAELQDRFVEEETDYGSDAGVLLEDVMQQILDDWGGGVALYVPVATGIDAGLYRQEKVAVLDAVQSLADLIGWVIEDRWDSGTNAWRVTLYEPNRTPTGTDWSFGPSDYFAVDQLNVQRYHIRNAVIVHYTDAATGERAYYTAEDPDSIAKYGRRWMEIEEASDSPINSEALAQGMADPALSDLAEPDAVQQITAPLFWGVQLGDFYEFLPNGVHYDVAQEFGVTGYTHVIENGEGTTGIRTRGKPVGSVRGWLRRGGKKPTPQQTAEGLAITNFREIGRTPAEITYSWTLGADLADSWIHDFQEKQPYADDRWPHGTRTPDVIDDDRDPVYTVEIPEQGWVRYLQVEGRTADGSVGAVERALIFPSNVQGDFIAFLAVKLKQSDGSVEIRGWATDRALSVAYAYNVGDADDPAPTVEDAEAHGGGASGGGLITGFTSDFLAALAAATVAFGQTIKVTAVAYIRADGTGADGTAQDHGPPVGAQDERFKITETGQIESGAVISQHLREGAQTLITDVVFGAVDWDTVEWSSGTLRLAGGASYGIVSGNTGNLASDAPRYIYLDTAVSTTVLQVAVAEADALGDGKILLAVAWRAPASNQEAAWVPRVGLLGINETVIGPNSISTGKIQALAIDTGLLAAGAVTAAKINVASLSAISADCGTITAGTISTNVLIAAQKFTAAHVRLLGDVKINGTGNDDTNENFLFQATGIFGAARVTLKDYTNRNGGYIEGTGSQIIIVSDGSGVVVGGGGDSVGFYGTSPVALQTGVSVDAAGIHAALVNLGLITA